MPTTNPINNYTLDPKTGCWNWQGNIDSDGYGTCENIGFGRRAHRTIYFLVRGSIPEKLHIDHLCRNRSCVNPAHLEAVTCAENIRRGLLPKLTPAQVSNIRTRYSESTVTQERLAVEYGVSPSTINEILRGSTWADIANSRLCRPGFKERQKTQPLRKLTHQNLLDILSLRREGKTLLYIAERFGISFQHVGWICSRYTTNQNQENT